MTARLLVALVTLCAGCQQAVPQGRPGVAAPASPSLRSAIVFASPLQADRVPLVSILSDPERWHGKPVVTAGYMHIEFEGNRLCLHRDDVLYTVVTNCVRLSVTNDALLKPINDRYVAVEGIVKAEGRLYAAGIEGLTSVAPRPTQSEFASWGR